MTSLRPVENDERALAVANASFRWAYLFQAFGLLVVIAARGFSHREVGWDLFAILFLGGAVASGYQLAQRTIGPRWLARTSVAVLCAAALGILGLSLIK